MEVCSPGLGRELVRPAHFKAYLGSPVQVRTIRPLADGRREFTAVLKSYEDGVLTLLDGGNETALAQNTLSECAWRMMILWEVLRKMSNEIFDALSLLEKVARHTGRFYDG